MTIDRRTLLGLSVLVPLLACGGDDPPPPPPPPPPDPTIVSVTLRASPQVNPDPTGEAKPVQVRLLRLASTAAFMEAGFFSLVPDPGAVLGGDLVAVETLTMGPGTNEVFQYELDDGTRFLGLMASYRDIENAIWRTTFAVPQNETSLITGEIGPNAVMFRLGP